MNVFHKYYNNAWKDNLFGNRKEETDNSDMSCPLLNQWNNRERFSSCLSRGLDCATNALNYKQIDEEIKVLRRRLNDYKSFLHEFDCVKKCSARQHVRSCDRTHFEWCEREFRSSGKQHDINDIEEESKRTESNKKDILYCSCVKNSDTKVFTDNRNNADHEEDKSFFESKYLVKNENTSVKTDKQSVLKCCYSSCEEELDSISIESQVGNNSKNNTIGNGDNTKENTQEPFKLMVMTKKYVETPVIHKRSIKLRLLVNEDENNDKVSGKEIEKDIKNNTDKSPQPVHKAIHVKFKNSFNSNEDDLNRSKKENTSNKEVDTSSDDKSYTTTYFLSVDNKGQTIKRFRSVECIAMGNRNSDEHSTKVQSEMKKVWLKKTSLSMSF